MQTDAESLRGDEMQTAGRRIEGLPVHVRGCTPVEGEGWVARSKAQYDYQQLLVTC